MESTLAKVVGLVLLISASTSENNTGLNVDYYWRDYTGVVPDDAVPGRLDSERQNTYIGQGFVKDYGIIPGVIYPGQKEITVPIYGTAKIDKYIKILCSPNYRHAFKWIPADSENFKAQTLGKVLVIGGIQSNNTINIGRILSQGELIIGKVVTNSSYYRGMAPMFYVHKNKEIIKYSYELLVYEDLNSNVTPHAQ